MKDIEKEAIKYILCDKGCENLMFQCDTKEERIGLNFKFTAKQLLSRMGMSSESLLFCMAA